MKTYQANSQTVEHNWVSVDADGKILGRLAVEIASKLMGKDKPTYTPHVDTGDFIVVTNCNKVVVTGKKAEQKEYVHVTGYFGNKKEISYERMMERHPDQILRLAVRRMLPKNKLGKQMLSKLKIYSTADHPHAAQNPVAWEPAL